MLHFTTPLEHASSLHCDSSGYVDHLMEADIMMTVSQYTAGTNYRLHMYGLRWKCGARPSQTYTLHTQPEMPISGQNKSRRD